MAIAAGAVHVTQVSVHTDEDPLFGMFFVVVGALQLLGGAYLARPLGPLIVVRSIFFFGIAGSLATIGIWALSRAFGLPFGAEPGEREEVGVADAAANAFELFTALLLLLWLRQERMGERAWVRWSFASAIAAAALAVLWVGLRALGILDPDPRLVLEPRFTDMAAVGFLVVVAALFAQLALWRALRPTGLASVAVVLVLVAVEAPLVAFTVPARGGQNLECRYAPIADDSGISHARPPRPIEMRVGERRSVVVLLLVACADAPVELSRIVPLQPRGEGVTIESFSIDRTRTYRIHRIREQAGPSSFALRGLQLLPGAGRYPVTVEVRAIGEGRMEMPAFRVDFVYRGTEASFGFASFTSFCVGHTACEEGR